ncbi:acetyl-CoA synthetase-like protein [Sanghuangporus baumii]|uniref:Acetyl-CoA synthetase-like protein n=1 Tax=Sanghuangporus baumii TaxID=108892 RepID=A0A9Q5I4X5_SANBA|nr:acetyl-CoA synthetase-like protein [Sanghuangporus baumii]
MYTEILSELLDTTRGTFSRVIVDLRVSHHFFRLDSLPLNVLPGKPLEIQGNSGLLPPTSASNASLLFGPELSRSQMSIHSAFAKHAEAHPEMTAIEHLDASITYYKLDLLSDRLAEHLKSMGITREQRVLLLVSRSIEMVIGIIGILKSGASYLPLDGGIVTDLTLATILDDAKPALIVTLSKFKKRVQGTKEPMLDIQEFVQKNDGEADRAKVKDITDPTDEAYVVYTSGTTGRPKGVSVSHSNVVNLILSSPGDLSIQPGTRVSQLLNIAFDMAAWEILGCLSNGGTLVLRPSGSDCSSWSEVLKQVDVVICTPSIIARFDAKEFQNIKVVATAANNSVYVLDSQLRPVPVGEPGVLWAGGAGVCRGYVGLPELTSRKFLPDPFSRGGVMYNTGDIGKVQANGELEHLGREDDQVKIKGFRVELDGVSACISSCCGVSSSAAILIDNALWAFYVPDTVSSKHVQQTVERVQPYYARPEVYVALKEMPLSANGKVDKEALRAKAREMKLNDYPAVSKCFVP